MGKPDPFLCTPAVHDGKRPPDRLRERKRKCGARRRTRRLYQCLPEVGEPWTAAGEGRTGRRIERDGNAVRRNCYHEKSVSKDVIIHRLIRFFYMLLYHRCPRQEYFMPRAGNGYRNYSRQEESFMSSRNGVVSSLLAISP